MNVSPESRRAFLIAQVQRFIATARNISGIRRISLIGSLTTTKPHPKDADLLVSVEDNADLTRLATLSRRIRGASRQINSGADIFLANPAGIYVGRMCGYRKCRPGIRMSCRALHCGLRPRLCDDLHVVNLSEKLVRQPPADLWPAVVRRGALPQDIDAMLAALESDCPISAPDGEQK